MRCGVCFITWCADALPELADITIILEFKVHNSRKEKTLEDTVEAALAQIEEKQYETSPIEREISAERIHKIG